MRVAALAVVALAVLGCRSRVLEERCVRNGGAWTAVNCRELEWSLCNTIDHGNGSLTTSCTPIPYTVCDHVCRGAAAETTR